MGNKVLQATKNAQVVWGTVYYMFSRLNYTGRVRDREKLCSGNFIILSRNTILVFYSSFYYARLACKLNRPVFVFYPIFVYLYILLTVKVRLQLQEKLDCDLTDRKKEVDSLVMEVST